MIPGILTGEKVSYIYAYENDDLRYQVKIEKKSSINFRIIRCTFFSLQGELHYRQIDTTFIFGTFISFKVK